MSEQLKSILSKLEGIFEDTFIEDGYEFSEDLSADDLEEWDSLGQIRLLTAVESEFGFQFDITQIEDLTSVGDIASAISEKTQAG